MTSSRPARLVAGAVALAGVLVLAACDSSSVGPHRTAGTSSPGSSAPASGGPASTASSTPPGTSSGSSGPTSGPGRSSGPAAKPIATQTIQGTHVTYMIDVYSRRTSPCTGQVTGADLVALVADNPCTVTRSVGTTTVNDHRIGLAEAIVHFTGAKAGAGRAATQTSILLTNSAGDGVYALLHDGARLPAGPAAVPANAARNAVNNGPEVTVVQAWYLTASTPKDDPRLNETVEDISAA